MNDAMLHRLPANLVALLAVSAVACAPVAPAAVAPQPARPGAPAATPSHEPRTLPPLTEEERDLAGRLRRTVEHLAVEIGERNPARAWNLASATDDLARTLEKMGYEVRRQGIVMGEDVVQNLEAHSGGGERGGESVVVAAHFDTVPGSPGADAATGAAALLELARIFLPKKTSRVVRFALLANGAAPNAGTDKRGSLVYGKDLVSQGVHVDSALCLNGLGFYSSEKASEHPPAELLPLLPETADFVAVVDGGKGRELLPRVVTSMSTGTLPVTRVSVGADSPLAKDSDCAAFSALGFSNVTITDTGPFRYPHHEKPTDLPKELDFERFARAVAVLAVTIDALAAS